MTALNAPALLEVDIEKRRGGRLIKIAFTMHGGITALTGPSGAGKTSVLDMIAGLLAPDRGSVRIAGELLTDTHTGFNLPAPRRAIGYAFQDARLFPHVSVEANLHYGRRARALPRDRAGERRIIDMLGIGALLKRFPSALSGGERQRVAVGRALMARPRLLLLDEPLASVDTARKGEILRHIEEVRDILHLPILYVTHAAQEVERLADSVVHMTLNESGD